jgi:hypothetical protein
VLISFFFALLFSLIKSLQKSSQKNLKTQKNPVSRPIHETYSPVSNRSSTVAQLHRNIYRFAQLLFFEAVLVTRAFTPSTLLATLLESTLYALIFFFFTRQWTRSQNKTVHPLYFSASILS